MSSTLDFREYRKPRSRRLEKKNRSSEASFDLRVSCSSKEQYRRATQFSTVFGPVSWARIVHDEASNASNALVLPVHESADFFQELEWIFSSQELVGFEKLAEFPAKSQRENFIIRAQRLAEIGQIDAALDLIYDSIDELLRRGRFSIVNAHLERVVANESSVDVLLGLLTATLPAKSKLTHRSHFFDRVEASLESRGELEEGLLTGLE